jgi:hypothetical protein
VSKVLQSILLQAEQSMHIRQTNQVAVGYWNSDGVWVRKQKLNIFHDQQRDEICLLTQTYLRSGVAFRVVKYVCHHTDWLKGVGTAILVGPFTGHFTVPVQGLSTCRLLSLSSCCPVKARPHRAWRSLCTLCSLCTGKIAAFTDNVTGHTKLRTRCSLC